MHHPGNPGAGSRPTPLPEMPKRQQRAAFVQQLEACIRIPSVRLPRTMRRMEMQGRGLRMLYLDDNNRISCHVQIPHALTMLCAVNTWSTPPRIRMTGIAAAGVSRTPAISTADALHAFAFCISPTACYRTPCRGTYRHLPCISTASREKRTFTVQMESCYQQASLNQGRMHPTLQVRTDRLLGPHPGLLEAALRAYTQQAFT